MTGFGAEFLVPDFGLGRGGRFHRPPSTVAFCGSFWLGLSMRLVTTLPQGLTSYYGHLAGWLCPPPKGERREGLLAEFVVLERVFGDPPPHGRGKMGKSTVS